MSLTATYDAPANRVVLNVSALNASTARVEVERFTGAILTNGRMVRGGDRDPSTSAAFTLYDHEFPPNVLLTYRARSYSSTEVLLNTFTATITVNLAVAWLKSPARPFLNRAVTIVDFGDVESPARGGVLEVLGRRLPVALTSLRGSRRYQLVLRAASREEADALELFLSFGDAVYVQVPAACAVPRSLYAFVGDTSFKRVGRHDGAVRYVTLPLTEVDAPDASISGFSVTWLGVRTAWATWGTLKADPAIPTWLALQQYVSAPADEVTG